MAIKSHIPNLFTCLNLCVGCLAIIAIFEGELDYILYYILIAGVLDFADGFFARILNATSPIGKDLDSLADMVTFGVVPSLLMFVLIKENSASTLVPYVAILIAVFSGLRLAKFNNDDRQTDTFYGLPTPANALFIGSLPLLINSDLPMSWLENELVLIMLVIAVSILLVANIKLLALKFKNFALRGNEFRYLLIGVSIALLLVFGMISIPLIIIFYVILSISANIFTKT